jgi:hypothetical protein
MNPASRHRSDLAGNHNEGLGNPKPRRREKNLLCESDKQSLVRGERVIGAQCNQEAFLISLGHHGFKVDEFNEDSPARPRLSRKCRKRSAANNA